MKYVISIILSFNLFSSLTNAMSYDVEKELNDKQKESFRSSTSFTKQKIDETCFLANYYKEKLRKADEDRSTLGLNRNMSLDSQFRILYKKYLENAEQCMIWKRWLKKN